MAVKRLYKVTVGEGTDGKTEMLVRATSIAGAIRTAVGTLGIVGDLATKDDIEVLLTAGQKVIEGPAEAQAELPV